MSEHVAIVGSRLDYWPADQRVSARERVRAIVAALPDDAVVISGDEPSGVDRWAQDAARERGLDVRIFTADWSIHGRRAGPIRNGAVARACTRMVALPAPRSKGTLDAIAQARRLRKPVEVIELLPPDAPR